MSICWLMYDISACVGIDSVPDSEMIIIFLSRGINRFYLNASDGICATLLSYLRRLQHHRHIVASAAYFIIRKATLERPFYHSPAERVLITPPIAYIKSCQATVTR